MQREIEVWCDKERKFVHVRAIAILKPWAVHKICHSKMYAVVHIGSKRVAFWSLSRDAAMALLFELLEWREDIEKLNMQWHDYGEFTRYITCNERGIALAEMIREYREGK